MEEDPGRVGKGTAEQRQGERVPAVELDEKTARIAGAVAAEGGDSRI
jgi:hypothetical protein